MLKRETATFTDSAEWSWEFDVTFMLSHYGCIWGSGCPDITGHGTARGCCVLGVEIYRGQGDEPGAEDLAMIRGRVEQLTDEDWQNRRVALRHLPEVFVVTPSGSVVVRRSFSES